MCRGKVTELKASAEKNELMPRLKTWLQRLWSLGFIGDRSIMKYMDLFCTYVCTSFILRSTNDKLGGSVYSRAQGANLLSRRGPRN